jgi:signal transduction histidine kinase
VVAGCAAAIALLVVVADGYFYPGADLPLAAWLVVATIGLSWFAELAGWRLPIWLLGAAQLIPLAALAVLHRADVGPLFLLLLVAWVGYTRTRREGAVLLACCVGFFWLATPSLAADGAVRLVGLYSWPIALLWASSLIPVWLAVRGLLAQQRLLAALRAAQADLARQAASDERRRIAREIHDIVAHSLTVTMLHLTGARYILARDPEGAAAALVEAERLGRQSLADVRRTIGLLEAEGEREAGSLAPLPTAEDIPKLVDEYAQAGLDAHYDGSGQLTHLSAAAGLALYRITQEALANVAKHAPGAHVNVELRTEADIHLCVSDDGRPAVAGSRTREDAVSGLGLAGMRERAVLLGGTLTAGPSDNGQGWAVECSLPAAASAA